MAEIWSTIVDMVSSGFMQFSIRDAIDILIVAYLIYRLLLLTRGTRAVQVLKGLAVLLLATSISKWINLQTITWLLDQAIRAGAIALVVIFQPELRRALEQIGRGKLFHRSGEDEDTAIQQFMKELTTAMKNMAARKVGALIILEHQTGLADIVSTGTRIDGMVSAAMLENIFAPNTPLHDGATILRGSTVVAAGCFLPLSDNNTISRQLGTRHRAALGVSEVSDCHAFVVSEESGVISMAYDGKLSRYLDEEQIMEILRDIYVSGESSKRPSLFKRRKKDEKK